MMIRLFACLAVIALSSSVMAQPKDAHEVDSRFARIVTTPRLADGQAELTQFLKEHPKDTQAQFALGATQFLHAVERLSQALYRYGATSSHWSIPLLRLPVPKNPKPDLVSYQDIRTVIKNFLGDLTLAQATLEPITDTSVKLQFPLGKAAIDINANGQAEKDEQLWRVYLTIALGSRPSRDLPAHPEDLVLALDYADVLWLRGYCHLLSTIAEAALMVDMQKPFVFMGAHLFDNPDVPAYQLESARVKDQGVVDEIADVIAALHVSVLPVVEPERGEKCVQHLQQVIDLSRQTWDAILKETDDDREWIPSPKQKSAFPQLQVTEQMVTTWRRFLVEAEDVLQGKKLVPHPLAGRGKGLNLRRVFTEPREYDLVLWIHGSAAQPYFEEGTLSAPDTWRQFDRVFHGQFIGFAMWFN